MKIIFIIVFCLIFIVLFCNVVNFNRIEFFFFFIVFKCFLFLIIERVVLNEEVDDRMNLVLNILLLGYFFINKFFSIKIVW